MELGGNAPFIVFDDCDMNVAINALLATKFRNAGQACNASNRYVRRNPPPIVIVYYILYFLSYAVVYPVYLYYRYRILVQAGIYDEFATALSGKLSQCCGR